MRNGAPFSKPKVRLYGETGEAQAYLGAAYNLLYKVRQYVEKTGAPVFAMSRALENGAHVSAMVYGNEEIVTAAPPTYVREVREEPAQIEPIVWLPEGFHLKVFTLENQEGWGYPQLEDGSYTPGGPIRDVLVNRFEHNKYPDLVHQDGQVRPRMNFIPAVFFFLQREIGSIGEFNTYGSAGVLLRQFERQFDLGELFTQEPEGDEWRCHRPKFLEFTDAARNAIFEKTNEYRAEVDQEPFIHPIRGWWSSGARLSIRETVIDGTVGHNIASYRDGFRTVEDRCGRRNAFGGSIGPFRFGEIGQFTQASALPGNQQALGELFASNWKSSPPHYAAMIGDWHPKEVKSWATINEIALGQGQAKAVQNPPYTINSPISQLPTPLNGMFGTCVFTGASRWLGSAPAKWSGYEGSASWWGRPPYFNEIAGSWIFANYLLPKFSETPIEDDPFELMCAPGPHYVSYLPATRNPYPHPMAGMVFMGGRGMSLFSDITPHPWDINPLKSDFNNTAFEILGAAVQRVDEDTLRMNVLVLEAPKANPNLPCVLRLMSKTLNGPENFEEVQRRDLHVLTEAVSSASFSADGSRCIVSAFRLVPNEGPYILAEQSNFNIDSTPAFPAYGSEIDFVELWHTGSRIERTESVDVTVSAGSTTAASLRTNTYNATVSARYRLLARYKTGQELEYIEVESTIVSQQSTKVSVAVPDFFPNTTDAYVNGVGGSDATSYYTNFTRLIFPNGHSITMCDLKPNEKNSELAFPAEEGGYSLEGFFVQMNRLDFDHTKCVFSRMDVDSWCYWMQTIKCGHKLYAGSELLAEKDNLLPEITFTDVSDLRFRARSAWKKSCISGAFITDLAPSNTYPDLLTFNLTAPRGLENNSYMPRGIGGWHMGDTPKTTYKARITPMFPTGHFHNIYIARRFHPDNFHLLGSIAPYINPSASNVAMRSEYKGEHVVTAHLRCPFGYEFDVQSQDTFGAPLVIEHAAYPESERYPLSTSLDLDKVCDEAGIKVGYVGVVE